MTNLEQGTNLNAANNNVTIAYNSTSGKVDVSTTDEKVKHVKDVSSNSTIPILLAGTTTDNGISNIKFAHNEFGLNPSTGTITLRRVNNGSIHMTDAGTLTWDSFSGTSARATADANGLNIATNYALKSEILLPEPEIVQSLPTSQSDIAALKGKFVFVLDSGASTDTKNVYTEYIVVGETSGDTTTYKFERIGSTEVNLDIDAITNNEIDTIWSTTAAAS